MRPAALLLAVASLVSAAAHPPRFVQAVEFPYYLFPQQLWERELVWMRNIGVDTVVFSIPRNWHEPEGKAPDFTGRTSPRRDLLGLVRLLRRVGMRAWIRPSAPVAGWIDGGAPPGADGIAAWLRQLEQTLAPQLAVHGGPIVLVEGGAGVFDAPEPPAPVTRVSAMDASALARSREAMAAGGGSLVWENVEDGLVPPGWETPGSPLFLRGAISLAGDERSSVTALRRDASLLRYWGFVMGSMAPHPVRTAAGRFPPRVSAHQLIAASGASAINLVNQSNRPYEGQLRAYYPALKRTILLPPVRVAAGEALWLPVQVPFSEGYCRACSVFAKGEHLVYATAELTAVEYENGILAMEFQAPAPGEVVLQLSHEPSGPLLAAGRPTDFEWDEKTLRARVPVPAGQAPGYRVRVGLAIQPPEASGFFVNAGRLILGQGNRLATSYSSEDVARRSRLRAPAGYQASASPTSPADIDYDVRVPADALHGEWAEMALEADGVLLSRIRVQLLRPASLRLREAVSLHLGAQAELPVTPALVPLDATAGRMLSVSIRNNFPEIRNYVLEARGAGFRFLPARAEVSIGAAMERDVEVRVFADDPAAGIRPAHLRLSGAGEAGLPLRFAVIPRGEAIVYSDDLDADGSLEWILENQRVRAVFTAQDGGRWLEFVSKDSGVNVLPEDGALAGRGPVEVSFERDHAEARLVLGGRNGRRVVRLAGGGSQIVVEQTTPLPPETLRAEKKAGVQFHVTRESPQRTVYGIQRAEK